MSPILLICIGVGTALLGAYTRAFQKSTLHWGRRLSTSESGTGLQDAITPPAQTLRNIASLILHIAVLSGGLYYLGWLAGIGLFVGTFLLGAVFGAMMPSPESRFFIGSIVRSLADRRKKFQAQNDSLRLEAIDQVIERFQDELSRSVHAA